jgi:hypothetical protein
VIPGDRQATIAPELCVSAPKTQMHVRPHAVGNTAEKENKQVKAPSKIRFAKGFVVKSLIPQA